MATTELEPCLLLYFFSNSKHIEFFLQICQTLSKQDMGNPYCSGSSQEMRVLSKKVGDESSDPWGLIKSFNQGYRILAEFFSC